MTHEIKEFLVNLPNAEPHKISYTEWGSGDKLLICVHGLTMNGRAFDVLAEEMAKHYRVICPDMPGRGSSEWLKNHVLYNNNYYTEVIRSLVASQGVNQVDWVGTSMGGLIGMITAALYPGFIRKMVLNDIGPYISSDGMRRILTYVKDEIKFPTLEAAKQRYREIYEQFRLTDAQIEHMAKYSLRKAPGGYYSFNHDPDIGKLFKDANNNPIAMQEFDLWRIWDTIRIPMMVLRGATSDILARDVAERMAQKAEFVEFLGYGHVPPLMNEEQIKVVKNFLLK